MDVNDEAYVAYHGFAYLKGAIDSHRTGLQIQLLLDHEEDYKVFKSFRKRRKGKAGSGLYRAFTRINPVAEWYGPVDMKFLRWTVSSANGAIITFELESHTEWRGMRDRPAIDAGYEIESLDKVELMLVELDTEGKPVNVKQKAKLEEMARKRKWPKGGPQSIRAARLCQDMAFRAWVAQQINSNMEACTVEYTTKWMRQAADIDSRAQLDHDPAALERFEDRVFKPFLRATSAL